jgi:protein farnesyltransferase subunit beta
MIEVSVVADMNVEALQKYVLCCCQNVKGGGLLDKPGKWPDFYHSCYCLSGLSISQHIYTRDVAALGGYVLRTGEGGEEPFVIGADSNLLVATHPIYNIRFTSVKKIIDYFSA